MLDDIQRRNVTKSVAEKNIRGFFNKPGFEDYTLMVALCKYFFIFFPASFDFFLCILLILLSSFFSRYQ